VYIKESAAEVKPLSNIQRRPSVEIKSMVWFRVSGFGGLLTPHIKQAQSKVSFLIKLAA
jgi:hypothetical protein